MLDLLLNVKIFQHKKEKYLIEDLLNLTILKVIEWEYNID